MDLINQLRDQLSTPVIVAVFVALISSFIVMTWFRRNHFDPRGKHCYIGGGSEGLGFALACQLADKGAHVSIVSRSEAKLKNALEQLEKHRQNSEQRLQSYACDLTSETDAAKTLHAACEPFNRRAPDFIFACAGGCIPGVFADMTPEEHWRCMEWNYKTALCTVHEGVRQMRDDRVQGKVVLTASVMGLMGFFGYSSYSPSKFAIRGLAECLRNELQLYGITTHLFLPATIFSPGFEQEQKLKPDVCKKIEGPDEGMTPDQVALRMIRGLERNEFYITYEPVGTMLRNSRGITPRNNIVLDTMWGWAGTIVFPFWRMFAADAEVWKEAKRLKTVQ